MRWLSAGSDDAVSRLEILNDFFFSPNTEAVMRRRRQQKLERKLQQFREESAALGISSAVCGPGAGGTLRIFGESLNKDVPYKTLLLSTQDSAAHVVREILEKYGMDNEDPVKYCLVQVNSSVEISD